MGPDLSDLTLLHGVGKRRAALLRRLGVRRCEDLLHCDLGELGWHLSCRDEYVTMQVLEGLRLHARSYVEGRPILAEPVPEIGSSYTVLDLDYEPFRLIWLIGLFLVDDGRARHRYLWAEDPAAERRSLEVLAATLRARAPRPVLSWAGIGADLPQLQSAVRRHGLQGHFVGAFQGHLDLFAHCERSFRLPSPALGLGPVASNFGFEREGWIENGLHAMRLFGIYRESAESASSRRRLRDDLVGSNREDLRALMATEHGLRSMALG